MTRCNLRNSLSGKMLRKNSSRQLPPGGSLPTRSAASRGTDRLTEPIPYVSHPVFHRTDPERQLARMAPLPEFHSSTDVVPEPGLTFVAGFVSLPLLTAVEEESLFAWMNFHRYRAEKLRRRW